MAERVLITGASGFIGANLARAEIGAGNDVHLLLRAEAKMWRLAGLDGQYTRQSGDLRDLDSLRAAVRHSRPDVVYHLATHGAYPAQKDRGAIIATNFIGTVNLVEALAGQDYRALVHTGSSSEYGHKDRAMRADDFLAPRTDYAVTKAAATLLCQSEALRGAPISTVRVFSAYGPWDDPGRVVPYVMTCCHEGKDPRLTAGDQPRDFIFIDDLVRLLQTAAHRPDVSGRILLGGSGRPCTLRDMVDTIVAVCGGGQVRPLYGSAAPRPDEPKTWLASIEQTTACTGWRPAFDLRVGVERTWAWHLQQAGPPHWEEKTTRVFASRGRDEAA
jgi:nucleoside-diphosphate-sugar epimerase